MVVKNKPLMRKGSILVLLSLMWLGAAAQQPEQEDSSTKKLLEVVVTAQRQKQPKLLVPFSVSTMDKTQIQQYQYRTTPEAMMAINGVFVQKTNHGGGSPFLRGVTGNQILILIDGIRLNNATFRYGPNQYLNTVDAYSIAKIEVHLSRFEPTPSQCQTSHSTAELTWQVHRRILN
jgi:outer membrane cobalamin receptor